MKKNQRKTKLINRRLQGLLLAIVVMAAGCSAILQACAVAWTHSQLAMQFPEEGQAILEELPKALIASSLVSLVITIPVMVMITLAATLRVFGPLYRFRKFLEAVIRGEQTEDCRLRKDDELKDLCGLLNVVTAEARARNHAPASSETPASGKRLRAVA